MSTATTTEKRHGVIGAVEVIDPHVRRSAKKAVEAAVNHGWRVEFSTSRDGSNLHVHLFPKSPKAWQRIADAGVKFGNRYARKYEVPARVNLLFDARTGAYFGGEVTAQTGGHLYSVLGDGGITDVVYYIEWADKQLKRMADDKREAEESLARQAKREAARQEWLADPAHRYGINKLQGMADGGYDVPDLTKARDAGEVMRQAESFASGLIRRQIGERALDLIGWPREDGTPIGFREATTEAAHEVTSSFRVNGAEKQALDIVHRLSDEYWGEGA